MRLIQLQKQKISYPSQTELVAQCDMDQLPFVTKEWKAETMNEWIASVQSRHELADDEQWLLCNDEYPVFKRQANK